MSTATAPPSKRRPKVGLKRPARVQHNATAVKPMLGVLHLLKRCVSPDTPLSRIVCQCVLVSSRSSEPAEPAEDFSVPACARGGSHFHPCQRICTKRTKNSKTKNTHGKKGNYQQLTEAPRTRTRTTLPSQNLQETPGAMQTREAVVASAHAAGACIREVTTFACTRVHLQVIVEVVPTESQRLAAGGVAWQQAFSS